MSTYAPTDRTTLHRRPARDELSLRRRARDAARSNRPRREASCVVARDRESQSSALHARAPNDKELGATAVLSFALEEVSAKIRIGPPIDDEADAIVPVWTGVVPVRLRAAKLKPHSSHDDVFEHPLLPRALIERSAVE